MPVGKSWALVLALFLQPEHENQTNNRMPASTQAKGLETRPAEGARCRRANLAVVNLAVVNLTVVNLTFRGRFGRDAAGLRSGFLAQRTIQHRSQPQSR
jgi:hypothetical protein